MMCVANQQFRDLNGNAARWLSPTKRRVLNPTGQRRPNKDRVVAILLLAALWPVKPEVCL